MGQNLEFSEFAPREMIEQGETVVVLGTLADTTFPWRNLKMCAHSFFTALPLFFARRRGPLQGGLLQEWRVSEHGTSFSS